MVPAVVPVDHRWYRQLLTERPFGGTGTGGTGATGSTGGVPVEVPIEVPAPVVLLPGARW